MTRLRLGLACLTVGAALMAIGLGVDPAAVLFSLGLLLMGYGAGGYVMLLQVRAAEQPAPADQQEVTLP